MKATLQRWGLPTLFSLATIGMAWLHGFFTAQGNPFGQWWCGTSAVVFAGVTVWLLPAREWG